MENLDKNKLRILLSNALIFMYEHGLSREEAAQYLGTTVDVLDEVEDI